MTSFKSKIIQWNKSSAISWLLTKLYRIIFCQSIVIVSITLSDFSWLIFSMIFAQTRNIAMIFVMKMKVDDHGTAKQSRLDNCSVIPFRSVIAQGIKTYFFSLFLIQSYMNKWISTFQFMQLFFKGSRDYCELFSRKACAFFFNFFFIGLRLIFVTLFSRKDLANHRWWSTDRCQARATTTRGLGQSPVRTASPW